MIMRRPRPRHDRRDDEEDEDDRVTRSLAGLAVVLFLAVAGLYLVQRLGAMSDLEDCIMSGRSNCNQEIGQ
jgi:hypothetical protein